MIKTKRWYIEKNITQNEQSIKEAAETLKNGGTVSFPTETVYGLGADATSEAAVSKIFKAKERPEDNPLIAHVASKAQLLKLVSHLPLFAEKMIDAFTPGPITFVLPSNGICADNVTAGLSTIAVRIPSHPVAKQILAKANLPIAAPSANISGRPSPTTAGHVWDDLQGRIDGLVDGGQTGIGMESTVVDCTQSTPIILRPGGITKEQIETVVGSVIMDPALLNYKEVPRSPGLKYKHYTPEAPLWIVEGSKDYIQSVINAERRKGQIVAMYTYSAATQFYNADYVISLGEDITEVATSLYNNLRRFKKGEVDLIVCESFPELGIGQAVMNRLHKAASKYIQE